MKSLFNEAYEEIMTGTIINEVTKSHLWTMMHGMVSGVKSIGIITAENPANTKVTPEENKKRNVVLKRYIEEHGFTYIPIEGKYNNLENPFLIQNISRKDLIIMANEPFAGQEAVIYGDTSSPSNLKFELIDFIHDKVNEARVFRNNKVYSDITYVSRALHGMNPTIKSIGIIENIVKDVTQNWFVKAMSKISNGVFEKKLIKKNTGWHDLFLFNIPETDYLLYTQTFRYAIWGKFDNDHHSIEYHYFGKKGNKIWKFPDLYGNALTDYYAENFHNKFRIPMFEESLEDEVDNFYSIYKGAKFVIPFFDDKYSNKLFVKNPDPSAGGQGGTGIGENWEIVKTMDRINEDAVNCLDDRYVAYGKRIHIYNGKKKLLEDYGVTA
jgi:hypothetical protein